MWQRIIQFFKRLLQRLFAQPSPPAPQTNPAPPTRSDTEYQALFFELLEVVHQGASRGQVKGWLMGKKLKLEELTPWLEEFGQGLRENQSDHQELARRMVLLGNLDMGELGSVAGRIGREILEAIQRKLDIENQECLSSKINAEFRENPLTIINNITGQETNLWFDQGCHQFKNENFANRFSCFEKLIELEQNKYEIWNNCGTILCDELEQYESAILFFEKAIEIKPKFYLALFNLGNVLKNLGRFEEAIKSYDKALEYKRDLHDAWNNRGLALHNLGRFEEAIESYDKALEYKRDLHGALYNQGIALSDLGRFEEAIESFNKALECKQDYHEAWINRGNAAAQSIHASQFLTSLSKIVVKHPELNQRGYKGAIICYEIGLDYCKQEKQPKGWGRLHHAIGRAHYLEGRRQKVGASNYYFQEAIDSYDTALKVVTENNFPELYLEILQDSIKVRFRLGEIEQAKELQRKATDGLRRLIEKTPSNYKKQQLSLKFAGFNQLTVDLAVKSGEFIKALELAEEGKNTCLDWMLLGWGNDGDDIPISYEEMRQFLTSAFTEKTAVVYWHFSSIAVTTFILRQDNPELEVIPQPDIQTFVELEDWLKNWNKSYQDYPQNAEDENRLNHPWRLEMIPQLRELKQLLRIDEIIARLNPFEEINHLILVPHRDLHYLPLEALFSLDQDEAKPVTLTRLPSLQIGKNLQDSPRRVANKTLLNIENPRSIPSEGEGIKKQLPSLAIADVESEFVSLICGDATRLAEEETTLEKVSQELKQCYEVLHFTGHGSYNVNNPKLSKLFLKDSDRLTLEEIIKPDYWLNSYQLVCLASCETAITGNQTILTEYVGLASAFLRQQVDHVLGTLWVVESEVCSLFVIEFYRRWRVLKLSKTEAFTQTQTWLRTATREELQQWCKDRLKELPPEEIVLQEEFESACEQIATLEVNPPLQHPYYWGAFILTGYER